MPPIYPAGSYPALVIADGASAYWRLGETSGTTAVDVIAGANGTISGGVTLGQAGALSDGDKAMHFPGAAWIDTAAIALPAAFTVEFWVYLTQARQHDVLGNRSIDSAGAWGIEITAAGAVYMFMTGVGTSVAVSGIVINAWHQVVFVNDGATGTVYRNGAQAGAGALAHPATTARAVRIGGTQPATAYVIGSLDEVAIYPTALTAPQIAAHYAARQWSPLPTIPWAVVCGATWSREMDSYNVWVPVTPHNTTDIPEGLTNGILVGGAGDVAAVMQSGVVVTLKGLPAGAWVPIAARRINSTGTTATDLVALYQN